MILNLYEVLHVFFKLAFHVLKHLFAISVSLFLLLELLLKLFEFVLVVSLLESKAALKEFFLFLEKMDFVLGLKLILSLASGDYPLNRVDWESA